MKAVAVALSEDDWEAWLDEQQQPAEDPPASNELAAAGQSVFITKCASCHQVNGLVDPATGDELAPEGQAPLVARHAPNLTHFMSRTTFVGALFDLYLPDGDGGLDFNDEQLEAWLRDPPGVVPMAADQGRGMPNLQLSDAEIDQLVAYLQTLGNRLDEQDGDGG
jgi:cytochrome c oxidase subunit 2